MSKSKDIATGITEAFGLDLFIIIYTSLSKRGMVRDAASSAVTLAGWATAAVAALTMSPVAFAACIALITVGAGLAWADGHICHPRRTGIGRRIDLALHSRASREVSARRDG